MNDSDAHPEQPFIKGGLPGWTACVLFAVFPLGLFLVFLEIFSPTRPVGTPLFPLDQSALAELSGDLLSVTLFDYATHTFVHSLVCLGIGLYFLSPFLTVRYAWTRVAFCIVYAAAVIFAVFWVTGHQTAFRDYMIAPPLFLLETIDIAIPAAFDTVTAFLAFALVFPSALGITVVVLATGGFHAILFSEPSGDGNKETVKRLMTGLRHNIVALSLILVSSTLTAQAFFNITNGLFLDDTSPAAKISDALAQSLSTGVGILFSATLVAAFAPGFIILMVKSDDRAASGTGLPSLWQRFSENVAWATAHLKTIWQSIAAIIAPALSPSVTDWLGALLS